MLWEWQPECQLTLKQSTETRGDPPRSPGPKEHDAAWLHFPDTKIRPRRSGVVFLSRNNLETGGLNFEVGILPVYIIFLRNKNVQKFLSLCFRLATNGSAFPNISCLSHMSFPKWSLAKQRVGAALRVPHFTAGPSPKMSYLTVDSMHAKNWEIWKSVHSGVKYIQIYIYYTIRIHILHKINIMYVYYISHSINYVVHITIYLYAIQFKNYPAALHKMHKYEMPTSQNSFKKNDFMICVSNAEIHRNTTTLGPQQHMEKMKVLICLNPSKDGWKN